MKIFFSILFDQPTYPQNVFMQKGVAVGSRHMGPLALLEFLELHLGLYNSCTNKLERIFNYRKNLHKNAKGSFYEKSLNTNDLEVAKKLLQWRDDLKTAGWGFEIDASCPPRLKDMANAEQPDIGAGNPERFCNVMDAFKGMPKLPVEEIIIHEPEHLLSSHLTELFALLAAAGVSIKHREVAALKTSASDLDNLRSFVLDKNPLTPKSDLKADGSIQVLRFGDMLSAGKGVAALMAKESFKPVIINESRDISLSLSLHENGLPSTGQALRSASHPDLQLLAIIPVWLWKPYDPQQILDFFLSSLNIFPKALSGKWLNIFSENPGICFEDWLEEIKVYATKFNSASDEQKHTERLNFILNIAKEAGEKIPTKTIQDCYSFFYKIFNARCAVTTDEQIKIRLQRLCNAFREFINVLQLVPEKELDAFGLQKLLQLVLYPVSVAPFEKQAGSLHEISEAGLLAGDCDDLLWFGFTANSSAGTLWDEWTTEETTWLKQRNVSPDTSVLKAKRDFWFLTQWLRFVKKRLILVIPSVVDGEASQPHPFHPFLDAAFKNLHAVAINVERPSEMRLLNTNHKLTKTVNINPIPSFPAYWNIKPGLLTKREEESFSSLEKLMKFPYTWVLKYKAELYRGNVLCLPDRFTFYGTLSHEIFQELLLMPEILSINKIKAGKLYKDVTEKYIEQKGLFLHAAGEEGNLKKFREYLFDKFWILVTHIRENSWQVEACEKKETGKIGSEVVGGYCDLLLYRTKNKKVEKAIVDLKYAGRKHRRLMEDGEDLQLAIYSKLFHPVAGYCPTSYFIITEGFLYTTCRDAFRNGIVLREDSDYAGTYMDALQRIENTVKFRRQELGDGKIEVGENVAIESLEIFTRDKASYILPKKEKDVKCTSTYNDYVTFIDTE